MVPRPTYLDGLRSLDVLREGLRLLRLFLSCMPGWYWFVYSLQEEILRVYLSLEANRDDLLLALIGSIDVAGCFGEALAFCVSPCFCFSGNSKQRQKDGSEFAGPSRRTRLHGTTDAPQ